MSTSQKWVFHTYTQEQHPTALDIIKREHISLRNKTVLVTGASDGIGVETVRAFAAAGARVFALVRSVDKTRAVLDKINAEFPQNGGLEIVQGDFTSLASVNAAANDFLKRSDKLNILVNNIGIAYVPHSLTQDGFEQHLAVNHIAHHLLFKKVAPLLIKSSTPDFQSRVVVVASGAHIMGDVDFDDVNYTHGREYTPPGGYQQSKYANVLFATHIERAYGSEGVHAVSLHPGLIRTSMLANMSNAELVASGIFSSEGDYVMPFLSKTIEQGAATTLWGAVSKDLEGKGGLYLEDVAVAKPQEPGVWSGYAVGAFDAAKAAKLWDWTDAAVSKFVKD
jgi:NAD(P)-dependent dehydrogenase (short-subunit alcohol dehydrogenase family)